MSNRNPALRRPGAPWAFLLAVIRHTGTCCPPCCAGVMARSRLGPSRAGQFRHHRPHSWACWRGPISPRSLLLQLPMGMVLDRYGVRAVLVGTLAIASLSCLGFAAATSFPGLFWARLLSGIGVSACLIAPLTAARLWTAPAVQQRINAWMLMAGALGLVLGTLPSESIATVFGWRPLFVGNGSLLAAVGRLIALHARDNVRSGAAGTGALDSYARVVRAPRYLLIRRPRTVQLPVLIARPDAVDRALADRWSPARPRAGGVDRPCSRNQSDQCCSCFLVMG